MLLRTVCLPSCLGVLSTTACVMFAGICMHRQDRRYVDDAKALPLIVVPMLRCEGGEAWSMCNKWHF